MFRLRTSEDPPGQAVAAAYLNSLKVRLATGLLTADSFWGITVIAEFCRRCSFDQSFTANRAWIIHVSPMPQLVSRQAIGVVRTPSRGRGSRRDAGGTPFGRNAPETAARTVEIELRRLFGRNMLPIKTLSSIPSCFMNSPD